MRRFILMTSCRTETETVSRMEKLDHSIVVADISQWRRHLAVSLLTEDILSTFCGVFMVPCVKLMPRIYEFGVLLFYSFVYRQNVTCIRYGHYAGEWET